jgi:alkaline phosphatase D
MRKMKPDFFVHTGDYVYLDVANPMAGAPELVCHKWNRQNALPAVRDFYAVVPSYIMRDDHDSLRNDCWPTNKRTLGDVTFDEAVKIAYDHMPIAAKPYRTFRWGQDLQIWMVEGREYRSPNKAPDGPEKTIWGKEQKDWFTRTVTESDATFKILFSPTPVVGPDRDNKHDNHANRDFATEGRWLRRFLADQKNMFVINGDRHWQYVSVCPETGVWEFSQGPASNEHAAGWKPDDRRPAHRFLRVNGGFVAAEVFRDNGEPKIRFTHYTIDGKPVHQEEFSKLPVEQRREE